MKLEFGNGNIFVTTYGDKDVNYGVAFRIVPENHAINESDPSVVGKTFEEVPHDLYFDFTKSESVQVVIDKLVMVRDDLRDVEVAEMGEPQEVTGDNQYLCSRCGHPEIDHPTHKCIGFAFEADKILGGIYMSDKERAQRLEAMIDRMSETIVELRRQLFFSSEETQKYRERVENLEKMITNKA